MPKENLTDRRLKSMKPAEPGKRYEVADGVVPGLLVRVTDKGTRTFSYLARYPGSDNPTRRKIGEYGVITLEEARQIAREWYGLLQKGVDPHVERQEAKAKELERLENTFGAAVEDYLRRAVVGSDEKKPILRTGLAIARNLRTEFVDDHISEGGQKRKGLDKRPLSGITKRDIMTVIDAAVDRGSPSMAHTLLANARMFFNWAIDSGKYGIDGSPCDRIKPKAVIGKKPKRKRVLTDEEIAASWEAASRMGYPYGPFYQMLFLTGLRRNEVADMPYEEVDEGGRIWTIPKERMKKENDHHVPLTPLALSVLKTLPKYKDGKFYFSTTEGRKPINGFSKGKVIFDREVLAALKRRAVAEGRDPDEVKLQKFVNHDIRRTVRTRLSALGVSKVVAELIIAHTQKDLDAVYDQWAFIEERRHALDLWTAKLRSLVEPAPENVINMPTRR